MASQRGPIAAERLSAAIPLLVFAWSAAWILAFGFAGWPPGNDSAYYLVAAKGFAQGRPFADLSSPDPQAGALLGPSCFPLLLSLYWRLLHPHLHALKILIALAMASAPVFAYLWLRTLLPRFLAALAALAFGCSYMFIVQGNSIMTECVFCPLLYAGLWLSAAGSPAHRPGLPDAVVTHELPRGRKALAAALLWAAAARTRVVGWAFLGAFAWSQGRRRHWIPVALAGGIAFAWVGLERFLARGIRVVHYSDGMWTELFPVRLDPWQGLKALALSAGGNVRDFATAVDAHILFPWIYEAAAMDRGKRIFCLLVFLWTAGGAVLAWRRWHALRPWLTAALISDIPTFLFFDSHDSFRYLLPCFPFLALFWLAPFLALAESSAALRRLPAAAAALLLAMQASGSLRHDFPSEYIDYPEEHAALHRALLALPRRPDLCLAGDSYYTYLETGCPSLQFWGRRHPMAYMRKAGEGKETWAICGPRNQYHCDAWRARGMVFGTPVAHTPHDWMLFKVEKWPELP